MWLGNERFDIYFLRQGQSHSGRHYHLWENWKQNPIHRSWTETKPDIWAGAIRTVQQRLCLFLYSWKGWMLLRNSWSFTDLLTGEGVHDIGCGLCVKRVRPHNASGSVIDLDFLPSRKMKAAGFRLFKVHAKAELPMHLLNQIHYQTGKEKQTEDAV